jgi:hypothetical protein
VFIFVNFSFALFTPPLGDYQGPRPRPRTRGKDKPSKPKSRRSDRRWRRQSRRRRNLLRLSPPQHRRQRPPARRCYANEWRPPQPAPADPHSSPRGRAGTDLRAEATCQSEDKTIQEHERRPSGVRRLGRSPGAHGATSACVADGWPGPDQAAGGSVGGHGRAS